MPNGIEFTSIADYLGSCEDLKQKIAIINTLINQLFSLQERAIESGHLDEYWFDDGHVKIRTKYRNVKEVSASIIDYERLKQMYLNRLTGRITRRMDSSNFTGRR